MADHGVPGFDFVQGDDVRGDPDIRPDGECHFGETSEQEGVQDMSTTKRIHIGLMEAERAIGRLAYQVDQDGRVGPLDADEAVQDMSVGVRQVVACDADGGVSAWDSWAQPVHIHDLESALHQAADTGPHGGFDLPEPDDEWELPESDPDVEPDQPTQRPEWPPPYT